MSQKRLLWQVDAIEQADVGGRRATGASSVCVDGRTKIYEEILDRRPFDYFTERLSLPCGVRAVLTTSLQPGAGVTRVVTRVRRDGGARLSLRLVLAAGGEASGRLTGMAAIGTPLEHIAGALWTCTDLHGLGPLN